MAGLDSRLTTTKPVIAATAAIRYERNLAHPPMLMGNSFHCVHKTDGISHCVHKTDGISFYSYRALLSRERPQTDLYFVGQEMDPTWLIHHAHAPVQSVGWLFTESAGFTSLGIYRCRSSHRTYRCTNGVGDSFRYHL
jgi:hypothetical protein